MVENQETSVISLTAGCRVAIWFSIQLWSLAILQNRVRAFFSIQAPTGSIPMRAREAVSGARIGRPCNCFKFRLWNASSLSQVMHLQTIYQPRNYVFPPHVSFNALLQTRFSMETGSHQ